MATALVAPAITEIAPIIVDLGKKKRKDIRRLKRGQGKLMDEVAETLTQVRNNLGPDADYKQLVPVVIVYRQKRKGGSGIVPFRW
jgi:hypothetical protein